MKTRLKVLFSILLSCLIFTGVGFNALSIKDVEASALTSARGMCVMEQDSKRVLYQKDRA